MSKRVFKTELDAVNNSLQVQVNNSISKNIVDAKGDIVTASAADTPIRLAVGTNEHRLVADSATTSGLKYVADTTNYAVGAKGDLLVGTAADTVTNLAVGTNGHVLTADSATTSGLKWAAASAPTAQGVSVYKTGTQSLTSGAYTLFTFDGEYFDTDGFHSTTTNTGRLTVPTGLGGKYLISVNFRTASGTFTDITCRLSVNGNAIAHYEGQTPGNSAVQSFAWAVPWTLVANDYVEFYVYHAYGSALNGEIDQDRRHFSIMRLGA